MSDRQLPAHLFQALVDCRITADEADRRAREHFERIDAQGDFNETIRAAAGHSSARRVANTEAARDAFGRFAQDKNAAMNEAIRAGARGVPVEQGTIDAGPLAGSATDEAA